MGLAGLTRQFFTFWVNCSDVNDDNTCAEPMDFGGEVYDIIPSNTPFYSTGGGGSYTWYCDNYDCYSSPSAESRIEEILCYYDWTYGGDTIPGLIGVVYDKSNTNLKTHVENVLGVIANNYYDAGMEYLYNDSDTYNFDYDHSSTLSCGYRIKDLAKYNLTEGSLLLHFNDEEALESYYTSNSYGSKGDIAVAIVFKSVSDDGLKWDYSIRGDAWSGNYPETFSVNEFLIVDILTKDRYSLQSQSKDGYTSSGFMDLQSMIDIAITEYIAVDIKGNTDVDTTYLQDFIKGYFVFPSAPQQTDTYWQDWAIPFRIFAAIMFIYPVVQIINVFICNIICYFIFL